MGLFDMKFCAICGDEIGLLGKRKCEDGIICKKCAGKLSPWFSERKKSTVAEIRQQLDYRKVNQTLLKSFSVTREFGHGMKIFLDEPGGKFLVTRSSSSAWANQNPDLIAVSSVKSCNVTVREHKNEIYQEKEDGSRVSFDPKQYEYEYEFRINLGIDSSYFPEIDFELSSTRPKSKDSLLYQKLEAEAKVIQAALLPGKFTVDAATRELAERDISGHENDTVLSGTTSVPAGTQTETTVTTVTTTTTMTSGQAANGQAGRHSAYEQPTCE